jgi:hypothetical protein
VKAAEEAKQPVTANASKILSPTEAARQRQINELQAQLDIIDRQLANNREEEKRMKAVITDYQGRVAAVPARESELVELLRDSGTLTENYSSLLQKREAAKLNENLVRRQIGDQFRVLDAASLPEKSYNRTQRIGVLLAGPVGGLFFGIVLIGFFEFRDSSFKTEDDIQRLLGLPVLALVPVLTSDRDRRKRRTRRLVFDVAGTVLLLTSVAVIVFWRLQS